jgi:hypothetical protein
VGGSIPLNCREDDVARFLLDLLLHAALVPQDNPAHFGLQLVFERIQEPLGGIAG